MICPEGMAHRSQSVTPMGRSRMAPGTSVLLLMMRDEMRAVLLGGIFSLPLMLGLALAYDRLLYGLPGFDFLSVPGAFVVLCSVGLADSIVPAPGAMEAPLTKLLIK
jgi:hypothetical protein